MRKLSLFITLISALIVGAAPPAQLTLSWKAVDNAQSYEVLSSTNLTTWSTFTNTALTSVVVPMDGPTGFYSVSALVVTNVPVQVLWDASSSWVTGYKVYQGNSHLHYTNTLSSSTTNAVFLLRSNSTYYFNATAVDFSGLESNYSGEVVYVTPLKKFPVKSSLKMQ